eukprot:scaffold23552_cov50-Phaeocystis_antarctica.AAC.1
MLPVLIGHALACAFCGDPLAVGGCCGSRPSGKGPRKDPRCGHWNDLLCRRGGHRRAGSPSRPGGLHRPGGWHHWLLDAAECHADRLLLGCHIALAVTEVCLLLLLLLLLLLFGVSFGCGPWLIIPSAHVLELCCPRCHAVSALIEDDRRADRQTGFLALASSTALTDTFVQVVKQFREPSWVGPRRRVRRSRVRRCAVNGANH